MALRTPPSWLQNGSHPAENDRLSTQALYATTGIIGTSSLAVTQNGTPNMSVNIAAGWAAILGTSTSTQGVYVGYNDASVNAAIATAPSVNSRIDLVCLTVNDAYYSGVTNNIVVNVVTGTVAASPVVPSTPANSIALAQIAVGTNVTSIVTANITDVRVNTTTNLPVVTLTGTQTLTNKTLAGDIFQYPIESWYINATAFAGYTAYLQTNNAVHYLTTASTANGTLNMSYASGTTLNSIMATGQAITFSLLITNTTAYYPNAYQIDGTTSGVTVKWSGGTAPSAGNASSVDVYQFTILKTASATWTVLAAGPIKYA
jgi:hypothetical protein